VALVGALLEGGTACLTLFEAFGENVSKNKITQVAETVQKLISGEVLICMGNAFYLCATN
jgi:hypothetical protein